MIKIIREKADWCPLITSSSNSDFYHTYDYHHLSKNEDESPILFSYSENGTTISLPLLLRKIEGTSYFDATSVYGYAGPTTNNLPDDFDNSLFANELEKVLLEQNIISVFSRLHPYIQHQENVLRGIGNMSSSGLTVNIDLTKDLDTQKSMYEKRLRTYINSSRKQCNIRLAKSPEDINTYIEMYYENMRRVNASQLYFFSKEYFFNLLGSKDFKTEILLATINDTNEIIGGAMFIKKNNLVQYHLSGAKEEFLSFNAIKLIIDEMRIRATQEGYDYLNLGGGVGGNCDSLFHFKSKFSKDFKDFNIWKYVVNQKIYNDIVDLKINKDCSSGPYRECSKFFPCYRCSVNKLIAH